MLRGVFIIRGYFRIVVLIGPCELFIFEYIYFFVKLIKCLDRRGQFNPTSDIFLDQITKKMSDFFHLN